jgi:hypothetical protein
VKNLTGNAQAIGAAVNSLIGKYQVVGATVNGLIVKYTGSRSHCK